MYDEGEDEVIKTVLEKCGYNRDIEGKPYSSPSPFFVFILTSPHPTLGTISWAGEWAWACGTGMCTAHGMAHSACVRASGVTVLLYCAWSSCRQVHVHVHVCARLEQLLAESTRH